MDQSVGGPGGDDPGGTDEQREPRSFFNGLVARLPDPAVVTDADLTVLAANESLCDIVEQPLEAVVGETLTELCPDLTPSAIAAISDSSSARVSTQTAGGDRVLKFAFQRQDTAGETVYLGTARDTTAPHRREERLDQYDRIFETIEDGIFTLDETFTIGSINSAIKSLTGYTESELVGSPATLLTDESTIDEAVELSRQLQEGDREVGTLTTNLETADGDSLPIETRFSPYTHADGTTGQVGVVRDISDRRRFARMLADLHDSTRRLLRAGTRTEVAEIIDETATDVLELPTASIYLFDRSANELRPMGDSGEPVGPNDGPVWDVFVGADEVDCEEGEHWTLSDHGVFYAEFDEHDKRTHELIDLLVSSAEAALERVDRESALREREDEYRQQNKQLRRLKEVNEIIRRVDRVLVQADTAAEIEQTVCEELTRSRWFSFAWLGRHNGSALEVGPGAGSGSGYLDAIDMSTTGEGGHPAVRTAQSGEPRVVDAISEDLLDERWRTEAVSREFQSVISVPLAHDGFLYGVLTVYADEVGRFGKTLESVFVELGESIANAIQEIQSRHRQPTGSVLELELSITAPELLLSELARRLDVTVTCMGGVPSEGGTTRLFVQLPDCDPEDVHARVESMSRVASVAAVSDDDRYEIVVHGPTLVRTLIDQGARLQEVVSTATGAEATVQVATATDVRAFVNQLSSHHEGVSLQAKRETETHSQYGDSMRSALEESLTDRQVEVLQTAYLSGFFEWPRETTGEEVAETLDITQPTVNRHLRVSERKLLELLFENG